MIRYLALDEVLDLHNQVLAQSGGAEGVRDIAAVESAIAQPRMTFGGQDLYATLADKAAALAYSLIMNHAFVDGNKRIGHAAMETFLVLNGSEIEAPVSEQEAVVLGVASGSVDRDRLTNWVRDHLVTITDL